MTIIVLRATKGSALTFDEVDANFTNLNNAGNAETVRAMAAESLLTNNLATAITTLNNTITLDINTEIARAEAAETLLTNNLNSSVATLNSTISSETSRAQAAEKLLSTNLATETTRAKVAEALGASNLNATTITLESLIVSTNNTEHDRALLAESVLTSALFVDVSNLNKTISTENTRAVTEENYLQSEIDAEITRAKAAEAALSSVVSTNANASILITGQAIVASPQYGYSINSIQMKNGSAGVIQFYDIKDPDLGIYNYTMIMDDGIYGWYFSTVNTPFDVGVRKMTLDYTGQLTCAGDITAFSDKKLKTNILKIENSLEKVVSLNGYTFDRIDMNTKRQTGVIAQEVLEVLPEAVSMTEDGIYSVAYGNMVGLLIEAIKELKLEIDMLKTKI